MKPWAPYHQRREAKNHLIKRWQLQTPGGHWRIELHVHSFKGTPVKAAIYWYESHHLEWHQYYYWETRSTFLITTMILEGRPFMQYVRDFLQENKGNVWDAVAIYLHTAYPGNSLKAIGVR